MTNRGFRFIVTCLWLAAFYFCGFFTAQYFDGAPIRECERMMREAPTLNDSAQVEWHTPRYSSKTCAWVLDGQ